MGVSGILSASERCNDEVPDAAGTDLTVVAVGQRGL